MGEPGPCMGSLLKEGRREPRATGCAHAAGLPASPTATQSLPAAAATPTLAVSVPLGPTVGPQGSDTLDKGPGGLSRPGLSLSPAQDLPRLLPMLPSA